jgi:prepilin-type N-terminal cleavage/methylation domain-containing protein/prepilin-type processing-associated H-X9-DG protein
MMGRQQAMKFRMRTGFTLVELLVVIAVIAVLAALLFPVFNSARRKAWQTTCISNERQIGMGLALYEQDFDQTYPNFRFWPLGSQSGVDLDKNSWRSVIAPYLRNPQIMVCPANPDHQTPSSDPRYKISYAANVALNPRDYPVLPPPLNATGSGIFGKDLSPGVNAASVVRPAECISIVEIVHTPTSLFVVDIATDYTNNHDFQVFSDCLFTAHSGLTNYLFADGHAKALKPTATYETDTMNYWYRDATPLGAEARTTLAKAEAHKD